MFHYFKKNQGSKQETNFRRRRKSPLSSHSRDKRNAESGRLTLEQLEPRWMLASVTGQESTINTAALITDPTTGTVTAAALNSPNLGPKQMEYLDRGIVVMKKSSSQVYISWRLLDTDPQTLGFNVYRSANGGAAVKLNGSPITATTDYTDTTFTATVSNTYYIRPVWLGVEETPSTTWTIAANASSQQYLSVPLQVPAGVTTPDGVTCTYSANDCSVGDVDGDGQYEIIVKWDPSNSEDNSIGGYTGNVYIDCYKLNGTRLWRIDLGKNIRAGAHYTQFIVYDLDGDGKAEVAMKTAPGTIDGQGNFVILPGDDPAADYRTTAANGPGGRAGLILTGPEYLTIFNGQTGANMATTPYLVARGNVSNWGDNYGNRSERYLACVAYLDGTRPSLVECRGYYAKTTLTAWNWRDGTLTQLWTFDSSTAPGGSAYTDQGDHSLTVADVDGDGKDEIVYGSCVINDDGTGLYSTGLGHGDAIHVGVFIPSQSGEESWQIHENVPNTYAYELHNVGTGAIIWGGPSGGSTGDDGRGCCDNILNNTVGAQMWSAASNSLYSASGAVLGSKPSPDNFLVWWDGDYSRELEDGTSITKYSIPGGSTTLLSASGVVSNNGTKSTPCLVADIFGDWREEVIWATTNSSALRIYTTTTPENTGSGFRIPTLMDDLQYRESIAWQNVAYNQPAHTDFYLGYGMSAPPILNMYIAGDNHILPTVIGTTPALIDSNGTAAIKINQMVVNFSEQMNSTDANASGNYELRRAVNGVFGDSDDVVYVLTPNYYYNSGSGASTTTFNLGGNLPGGLYRLTVRANGGAGGLRDLDGNYLDGDLNNMMGGDYIRTFTIIPTSVTSRMIFYNDSKFDTASDNGAIATDKTALLPGQTPTFANYTSYSRGINGIMVDIQYTTNPTGLTAADFQFQVGNGAGWTDAPAPLSFSSPGGGGVNGSDRVTITWDNNLIQNEWLKVTVLADANTGLDAPDVFYFGNLMGESGNDAQVSSQDEMAVANNRIGFTLAAITNNYDYNRDRQINASDAMIARRNAGATLYMPSGPLAAEETLQPVDGLAVMPADTSADTPADLAAPSLTVLTVAPVDTSADTAELAAAPLAALTVAPVETPPEAVLDTPLTAAPAIAPVTSSPANSLVDAGSFTPVSSVTLANNVLTTKTVVPLYMPLEFYQPSIPLSSTLTTEKSPVNPSLPTVALSVSSQSEIKWHARIQDNAQIDKAFLYDAVLAQTIKSKAGESEANWINNSLIDEMTQAVIKDQIPKKTKPAKNAIDDYLAASQF